MRNSLRKRQLTPHPAKANAEVGRRGFTLIEAVVTVGIIATVAAFVVPSVMRKADAADPVKVANDLNSISTAVQSFASDVKGALPGDLEDLTTPLLVNTACTSLNPCDSTVTHAAVYTIKQAQQWKGPYLAASVAATPTALLRTGYLADISNVLVRYDETTGMPEFCETGTSSVTVPCAGFVATNPLFIGVRVLGLNDKQAALVNELIDGPNEARPGLEGRFRYPPSGGPAYFLAAPVP
jgi:prepilin-type N-terminal cleavage/methylation domain-containing protein